MKHADDRYNKEGLPLILRYTPNERSNHWITAICFVLLAVSGLAMFHPATVVAGRVPRRRAVDAHPASLHRRW